MQDEKLPRGFKKLSDRYPSFQILYATGSRLNRSMNDGGARGDRFNG